MSVTVVQDTLCVGRMNRTFEPVQNQKGLRGAGLAPQQIEKIAVFEFQALVGHRRKRRVNNIGKNGLQMPVTQIEKGFKSAFPDPA